MNEDPEGFQLFFPDSGDERSKSSSESEGEGGAEDCQQCAEEVVHDCPEDMAEGRSSSGAGELEVAASRQCNSNTPQQQRQTSDTSQSHADIDEN